MFHHFLEGGISPQKYPVKLYSSFSDCQVKTIKKNQSQLRTSCLAEDQLDNKKISLAKSNETKAKAKPIFS